MLGAAEDQRGAFGIAAAVQQRGEGGEAQPLRHQVDDLRDGLRRARLGRAGVHAHRVVQVLARDFDGPLRQRRGEKPHLALRRRLRQNALHVRSEAGVEHLVRLIEHAEAQGAQVKVALPQMIQHAARRADGDLRARQQRLALRQE